AFRLSLAVYLVLYLSSWLCSMYQKPTQTLTLSRALSHIKATFGKLVRYDAVPLISRAEAKYDTWALWPVGLSKFSKGSPPDPSTLPKARMVRKEKTQTSLSY